ncbi:hypothetical protein OOK13_18475 [Streptomyces sp. NBC_00378]|uniref:hypothetical protein n=2 Tax=unclassified Streptomyces TaxID=2593676 RepID=UPI00224E4187|nr:hypothetical protein [Streptomyces sp. NBC_00378]MCX5110503.1 hypothetical protein [Streptomyces sp. NBC_00378]
MGQPGDRQEPNASGGVLKHGGGVWLRAAGGVEGMCTHLGPVKPELETAHEGLLAGTGGLTAMAELGAVRESWTRRFEAARGECRALAGKLRAVARIQGGTDETVRSALASVSPEPEPEPEPEPSPSGRDEAR